MENECKGVKSKVRKMVSSFSKEMTIVWSRSLRWIAEKWTEFKDGEEVQ